MTTVVLGWRRLYDALGVTTEQSGEIAEKVQLASGKSLAIYIGPTPPIGIVSIEGSQFGIPGRQSHIFHENNEYKSDCFLEVSITYTREITPEQSTLLSAADKATREELLEEVEAELALYTTLLDAVSGILGLLIHRQFVLKPLIEHAFFVGGPEPVRSFSGPWVEILEGLALNQNTGPKLANLLRGLEKTPENVLSKGGLVLYWLLKAWRESDSIAKFMYLFIPLEATLQVDAGPDAHAIECLESLETLVEGLDVPNKDALHNFLAKARTTYGPTLNSRFEEFAKSAAIPGWELDVEAFKKFNRMRNLLLHAGNKNVRGHIDFEQNTRTLEDLVERYVSVALLGTPDVYKSTKRPTRDPAA